MEGKVGQSVNEKIAAQIKVINASSQYKITDDITHLQRIDKLYLYFTLSGYPLIKGRSCDESEFQNQTCETCF